MVGPQAHLLWAPEGADAGGNTLHGGEDAVIVRLPNGADMLDFECLLILVLYPHPKCLFQYLKLSGYCIIL